MLTGPEMLRRAALAAFVLLAACGSQDAGAVVARVNGHPISADRLAAALPWGTDTSAEGMEVRHRFLDDLVTRELFVEEAERRGLGDAIADRMELEKKALLTQRLFDVVAEDAGAASELELQAAHRLLLYESHIATIAVPTESLARLVLDEFGRGVPFETLAVRHSTAPDAAAGGDQGYQSEFAIQEPFRSAVLTLEPGDCSEPLRHDEGWLVIHLIDRRPADPPPPPIGEMRQELEWRVEQQRRRQLIADYVADLRARLRYNPAGLAVFYRPVDSITEEEKETWVAIRDERKYVKVGRLLHIARRFPASLDTAIRTYAIKRAIEEDLLYEDALERGVAEREAVRAELEEKRRQLLYEALFRQEISDRVDVTEPEIRSYYETHRENYLGSGLDAVAATIRYRLQAERRDSLAAAYRAELRSRARVEINEAALARVARDRDRHDW